MKTLRLLILLSLMAAGSALAQGSSDVFARARRMVNGGDARAGRALVDSMLRVAPPGSAAYAEALYWRGVLGADGENARLDLLRVAIEFSTSPRASDALLRLAQAEFTRGDRLTALRHLEQLEREHPDAPARAMGRYWTARILLEDGQPAEACAALRDARRLAASGEVELKNQIEFYARGCGAETLDAGRSTLDSAGKTSAAKQTADSRRQTAGTTKVASATGKYSVQIAVYADHDDALALVKRLKARGFDARVTTDKPWRVRVGYYATRAEAADAAVSLSSKATKAIVVDAEGR